MDLGPRKRVRHYDTPGHAHYLTFSCYRRRPLLACDGVRSAFLDALAASRAKVPFDLWAYVVMPEHAHLLVWPHEGASVSEILRHVKLPVAKRARVLALRDDALLRGAMAATGPGGRPALRVWQRGGGYDRNLWSPNEIREKVDYIHANPVRRGLVAQPGDWPWSSWRAWRDGVDEPVAIDRASVPAAHG